MRLIPPPPLRQCLQCGHLFPPRKHNSNLFCDLECSCLSRKIAASRSRIDLAMDIYAHSQSEYIRHAMLTMADAECGTLIRLTDWNDV